ncbi:MAG: hypothetical protein GOMPHAMPRED_001508 [Gomphillus americanus]|uniref:Zn(2)-C6 fungal-type domain-containing protein n=1 Tax=Gomphillus americanus TaxID=1940652 RepID=A0A8H3F652_9LECA|nr:MAG: hypothetical protein GOMPHAMPRED_001508 [Gomphillus americanus]
MDEIRKIEKRPKCSYCQKATKSRRNRRVVRGYACDRERPCKTCVENDKIASCSYWDQDRTVMRTYLAKEKNQHFREGVAISEEEAICTHCKSHQLKCSGESPCSRCLKKYRTVGYIASCVYRKPNGHIERYFLKYYKPSQDGTNRAILLTEDELGRGEQYADRGISAARRSFNQTFANGYETVYTRSDGFQCGLFAIQISLMHQFQLEIDIEALRQAHSTLSDGMAEFNMSNDGNFSLDQLVAILNAVPSPQRNNKRYSIGCILADCTAIIFPAAQGQGEPVVTLWIHNNENRSDSDVEVTGGILLLLRGNTPELIRYIGEIHQFLTDLNNLVFARKIFTKSESSPSEGLHF